MTLHIKYWVASLLGFSGLALSLLVPGGPVETRSFGHINPLTLGIFNTFLTTLGLGSLLLIYFVLKSERWAMFAAAVCGLSYLGVYGLDLAQIFPVSPDVMPSALLAIEVLGTLISFPLMALSIQALRGLNPKMSAASSFTSTDTRLSWKTPQALMVISLGMIALGIIAFATRSAMGA
jgi:hypothetical protein